MPNSKSAAKRLRQSRERNLRNRIVKSEIKTHTKKVLKAVEEQDAARAGELLRAAQAKLDKAVKKGTLHANTVARRKSLLFRKVAALGGDEG
ncbi:MAG: 30S ribosomal protein S20 [Planctomycetota bacterium]